jgi:hypothetical protein
MKDHSGIEKQIKNEHYMFHMCSASPYNSSKDAKRNICPVRPFSAHVETCGGGSVCCQEARMVVNGRGNKVSPEDTNRRVKISGVEARQGPLGRPVLMVLVASLVLALIAWAGAEIFGESTDNDAATQIEETTPAAKDTDQGIVDNAPATGEQMQPAPVDKDPTPQTGSGG